jgi:hypothetical protein
MNRYIIFASIGFELVGLIVGCFYLGQYLDAKFNTGGMAFVGLSVACLIGWLVRFIWLFQRIENQDEEADKHKKTKP